MSDPSSLPAALRARILANAARTPAAEGGAFARRWAVVGLAASLWLGALIATLGRRPDWLELPWSYGFGTVVAVSAAAAALTAGATTRGRGMLGAPVRVLLALALGAPLVVTIWLLEVTTAGPSSLLQGGLRLAPVCDAVSIAVALPVLGAFVWLRRGLVSPAPELVGGCAGAAAAAWAHVVVHAHCPFAAPEHILVGHVLPMLPMMLVGAFAGRRWLR